MKKLILSSLIFSVILLFACNQSKNNSLASGKASYTPPSTTDLANGYMLVESNCFSCHSPNATIEQRIAPPMEAVKRHYLQKNTSEEQFTKEMIAFLNNPSTELSKMPRAIERFNLMPKMSFNEDQLKSITAYIYHTQLEKPGWFEKHYRQEKKKYQSTASQLTPIEQGQKLALQTKAVLGKNLLEAINTQGTEHALEFCSTKAIHLTDSMSNFLGVSIKRVSDKPRNPNNAANAIALEYIKKTKARIAANQKPTPQLLELTNKSIGYYPIMTNNMCMQCHGKEGSEILPNTLVKIKSIYPQDMATGYQVNDLRGIWVVEMDQ